MLTIRLSRTGKHKAPQYRIVVQEKSRDPWSPAIEIIGTFNPRTNPATVNLKTDRAEHWLKQGAQPSGTVHNLFVDAGLIKSDKQGSVTFSKKRRDKMAEAKAAEEEKKRAAEEAAKAEAEAAKTAAEAPAEEAPAVEAPVTEEADKTE